MNARPHSERPSELSARADTKTVQEILSALGKGRLRVPTFQRGTRWREDDRVKLFDSILRGIPVGTLLFSEPFRGLAGAGEQGMLVLDGQQRTETLRALVSPLDPGARSLHLDTRDRSFRYARTEPLDASTTLIPVGLLGDADALLDALLAPPVPRETMAVALDVSRRLREYRVPVYELHDVTEEEARLVFDRINATGRRLRQAEVFNALHARDGDAPVPRTSHVVTALERLGFGSIAEDEITKAVAILTGHDPGRDVRAIKLADAAAMMKRVEVALARAITFLQGDAAIPHRHALPYVLPLLVLARLFDRHPEVSPRSRILLRRWVWRGAATGAHQGARASLRDAIQAIGDDEHDSVQALLAQVPRDPAAFAWDAAEPVRTRPAADRIALCALAGRGPVDLRDGRTLDATALAASWSLVALSPPAETGRCWSVVVLHPHVRRASLVESLARAPAPWIASHVVSDEARSALLRGDLAEFAAARGRDLHERVRRFLNARAEWSALDAPALDRFVDPR